MPLRPDRSLTSLHPKRHHRIDTSRSSCRNPDCKQGHRAKQQGRRQKSNRIKSRYSKEEAGQEACEPQRTTDTNHHPNQDERHSLAQNHAMKVGGLCAQRQADAEFLGALLHGVRHDSKQTDCRHE